MEKGSTAKPTHILSDLSPEGVATSGATVMAAHLSHLAGLLCVHAPVSYLWAPHPLGPVIEAIASSTLGFHLKRLTRYAQTGDVGDRSGVSVDKSALDVLAALTTSPSVRGEYRSHQHVFDSDTAHATVLLAARARLTLDEGERVPHVTELAALTGLLPSSLRYLQRQRVVLATDVADQRRFCVTRGVTGLLGLPAEAAAETDGGSPSAPLPPCGDAAPPEAAPA